MQVAFVQHDDMIQTLSPYGADEPFAVRILPGRAWSGRDFFDVHVFGSSPEFMGKIKGYCWNEGQVF